MKQCLITVYYIIYTSEENLFFVHNKVAFQSHNLKHLFKDTLLWTVLIFVKLQRV